MNTRKMLAVRLPGKLVDTVKDYAATEGKKVLVVVEEFMRMGLARSLGQSRETGPRVDNVTIKKLYRQYRQAINRGEVVDLNTKKMLAVRLPGELVDAIRDYAAAEEKNIVFLVEEFISSGLVQKKGREIDIQALTTKVQSPFRRRPYRELMAR